MVNGSASERSDRPRLTQPGHCAGSIRRQGLLFSALVTRFLSNIAQARRGYM
jgi:hypothetical protein